MKVVLTGGPAAGKTTIVQALQHSDRSKIAAVEEAASLLYRGGFPRSSERAHRLSQQSAIYFVQKALEEIGELDSKGRILVCDRGSLDGLAYWPGTETSFFAAVHSSMSIELKKYQWVIHLDTANATDSTSTSIRLEEARLAAEINERVKFAWREHPQRLVIPSAANFVTKVTLALKCMAMIQERRSNEEIRSSLAL